MFMSFKIRDTKNKANARYKTIYLSLDTIKKIDAIAAAEKQARAICEQAKVQAAELSAQAEKDGADEANKNSAKE